MRSSRSAWSAASRALTLAHSAALFSFCKLFQPLFDAGNLCIQRLLHGCITFFASFVRVHRLCCQPIEWFNACSSSRTFHEAGSGPTMAPHRFGTQNQSSFCLGWMLICRPISAPCGDHPRNGHIFQWDLHTLGNIFHPRAETRREHQAWQYGDISRLGRACSGGHELAMSSDVTLLDPLRRWCASAAGVFPVMSGTVRVHARCSHALSVVAVCCMATTPAQPVGGSPASAYRRKSFPTAARPRPLRQRASEALVHELFHQLCSWGP